MLQLSDLRRAAQELQAIRRTLSNSPLTWLQALQAWREKLIEKKIEQRARRHKDGRAVGADPHKY